MTKPPDATEKTALRRLLFISGMHGRGVTLLAGVCTLLSFAFGEWVGVMVGALIAACGLMELRGRARLLRGDSEGLGWLVRAELLILAIIWVYALENMLAYDEATMLAGLTPEMKTTLDQAGLSVDDLRPMMKPVYYGFYLTVMGVTLVFQGGLAFYYWKCRRAVKAALSAR